MNLNVNLEDIGQITSGAFVLAGPISFSEEAWNFGETLQFPNLLLLFVLSLGFLARPANSAAQPGSSLTGRNRVRTMGFRLVVDPHSAESVL